MSKELRQIEKKLKEFSYSQVAVHLGYRSPNTIVNWVKKGEIPVRALDRVRKYLRGTM